MSATKNVMIVLPIPRDKTALEDIKEGYRFYWMEDENFLYPSQRPKPEFDMIQYTERCSEYVKKNNIQAVLYSHDLANYVAGVLCERHNLPGPTLESMFLCNHKYYSRRAEVNPIWSDYIDLDTGAWGNQEPRFPCYIKPVILTRTRLQYTSHTPEELEREFLEGGNVAQRRRVYSNGSERSRGIGLAQAVSGHISRLAV